jgi:uncharacterized protein YkwD
MNFGAPLQPVGRRSFLKASAAFALLKTTALAQIPIERGRFSDDNVPQARERLLKLVNDERTKNGLSELALDELACTVATAHALDMMNGQFLSHWSSDGRKPYQRYSFAGGVDAVQENLGLANNIESLMPYNVFRDLDDVHTSMYLETPPQDGHRRTILFPSHTHVGFGIALNGHNLRLAELYLARYLTINPISQRAARNATVVLTGKVLNPKYWIQEVDVYYEPLPTPPEAEWLRTPRSYSLPTGYSVLRPRAPGGTHYLDGTTGDFDYDDKGRFRVPVKLFRSEPAIYTVVFALRKTAIDKAFPAAQICIRCE